MSKANLAVVANAANRASDAFDDQAPDAAVDRQHLAALAFVIAGDDFHCVVCFDVHVGQLSVGSGQ